MNVIQTEIPGVVIIEPKIFGDSRGYFYESFSEREFVEKVCQTRFVQDNQSKSCYGVVRGLHFQKPPHTQAKLVRVVSGRALDVAVDLREGSETYGKHFSIELSGENHLQVFIPKGFAHGFMVMSEIAELCYKCSERYHPGYEGGIAWNDPTIGIIWPGVVGSYPGSSDPSGYTMADGTPLIFSDRDLGWPTLADIVSAGSGETNCI